MILDTLHQSNPLLGRSGIRATHSRRRKCRSAQLVKRRMLANDPLTQIKDETILMTKEPPSLRKPASSSKTQTTHERRPRRPVHLSKIKEKHQTGTNQKKQHSQGKEAYLASRQAGNVIHAVRPSQIPIGGNDVPLMKTPVHRKLFRRVLPI